MNTQQQPNNETKPELKPCPFCGNQAKLCIYDDKHGPLTYQAECESCGTSQNSFRGNEGKIKVIAYWNRRTPDGK